MAVPGAVLKDARATLHSIRHWGRLIFLENTQRCLHWRALVHGQFKPENAPVIASNFLVRRLPNFWQQESLYLHPKVLADPDRLYGLTLSSGLSNGLASCWLFRRIEGMLATLFALPRWQDPRRDGRDLHVQSR
jgi:hypothetical protein